MLNPAPSTTPPPSYGQWLVHLKLFVLTFVVFFVVLYFFELIPEIGLDIDFKPFFIPITLLVLFPRSSHAWAIGLAVAGSELLGDFFEPGGVEPDDPIGFFGYLVGALAAGAVMQGRWQSPLWIVLGGLTYALVNGMMEAAVWLALGEFGTDALQSLLGNMVTHGIIAGGIVAIPLARLLKPYLTRWVGIPTT